MQQKTNWMRYLRNGIEMVVLILILSTCKVDFPFKKATYTYKNESGVQLQMAVKNRYIDTIVYLADKASYTYIANSLSGEPFTGRQSSPADSVGIKFATNQCLSFIREEGNGVFELSEYENYVNGMEEQTEFSLTFIFDEDWLAKAQVCN